MTTQLLIIRSGREYIRFRDGVHECCPMNKASVFGLDRLEEVEEKLAALKSTVLPQAEIRVLTITEEPFQP